MLNAILVNKKTSFSGSLVILMALLQVVRVLTDGNPETMPNLEVLVTELAVGLGLIFGRDADKTSKESLKK